MLKQKFALRFGSDVIIRGITSITAIIVARIVGPTVFGTLAFGLAYIDVFGFLMGFFDLSHLKLISEEKDMGNCISTFSRLQVMSIVLFGSFTAAFIFIQKNFFNLHFETKAHETVVYIFFLHLILTQLMHIPLLTFIGKIEQAKFNIVELTRNIILNVLRIMAALLGYKAIVIASTRVVAILIILPAAWFFFRNYPRGRWDKELAKKYIAISAPLFVVFFIDKQIINAGKVLLQFFTSSEEVGIYSASYGIISVILLLSSSAGSIFFPLFSKAVSRKNYHRVRITVYKFERFIFIHLIPALIFLSLYAGTIIRVLLGNKYSSAGSFIVILIAAAFFQSWFKPYGDIILGLGEYKLATILNLLRLGLFLGLSVIFMAPSLANAGAKGLSISLLVTNIFIGTLYYFFALKKCGTNTLKENYKYIIHGIVSLTVWLFIFKSGIKAHIPLWFFIFPVLFFAGHYLSLYATKLFTSDDIKQLLSLLNLRKLLRYIKDEINPDS